MKVKIVAHFSDEDGKYSHADLSKPLIVDVREAAGKLWVQKGWAIALPEEKKSSVEEEPTDLSEKPGEGEIEDTSAPGAPETTEGLANRRGKRKSK